LFQFQDGTKTQVAVFSPECKERKFEPEAANPVSSWSAFFKEGVWHIWNGFDHILFLFALLLPSVLSRTPQGWVSAQSFGPVFRDVFKVVTAFTIAHSLTLSLAVFQIFTLPSRLVESVIAFSVLAAALNNTFPIFRERTWIVAFCFGLIHGFGFAAVLTDLGLPRSALALTLASFNLGVEAGQMVLVAAFLPLAFLFRSHWLYRSLTLRCGSALIAVVAAVWLTERLFDVKWLPF
jgi:hypothetical protein